MTLKTDYKDDILATGNLRKYQMIQNNDGTVSFQDVTQYAQIGDVFGAGDINRTNQAVNEKVDSGDVVDPMLTTEPGFAADAYQTKLQFDEQNKKSVTYNEEDDTLYINGVAWKSGIFYNDALVPLLTGYNGSNGHVVYNGINPQDTTRYPWYAFDRNDSTYGLVANASEEYIGYIFNNKVYVNKVELIQYNVGSQSATFTRKIQYYDGVNWNDVKDTVNTHTLAGSTTTNKITYEFTRVECYGIRVLTNNGITHAMKTIQIYGREAT